MTANKADTQGSFCGIRRGVSPIKPSGYYLIEEDPNNAPTTSRDSLSVSILRPFSRINDEPNHRNLCFLSTREYLRRSYGPTDSFFFWSPRSAARKTL